MTTYHVSVGNREYLIDVSDHDLRVDGQPIQANLIPLNQNGLFVLDQIDKKREVHVHPQGRSTYAVMTSMRHIIAQVERKFSRSRFKRAGARVGDLLAPMPGLVVNVNVNEGDQVSPGQLLVVLESMKMQMEFRAPFAGLVQKVAIQARSYVEKGALMVQMAPA